MNDFFNNISRYPRFFISSLIGLILIIISPFRNLFKIQRFRFFILILSLFTLILFYFIIANMAVF